MKPGQAVAGERTFARVAATRSMAHRAQRVLAAGLVIAVGAAVLIWYYAELNGDTRARARTGTATVRNAVTTEMKLPALEAPHTPAPSPASEQSAAGGTRIVEDAPAAHGRAAPHADTAGFATSANPAGPGAEPPARNVAPVLMRIPTPTATADGLAMAMRDPSSGTDAGQASSRAPSSTLADALQPTLTKPAEAALFPSRRWLLPKGSFLDCTLETAIDSTFAGLTTCILAMDVFGADGRVVLMERGTKLIGETRSDIRTGQTRVAVLWNEAQTPTGVVLDLASPGTDALGRAGIPGTVDRHTAERFGAAVLLSVLDSAIAAYAAGHNGSGAIIYNTQSSRDVATEALRHTITIPPTIRIAPGARMTVTVVRDIDFRAVYRLAPHAER